MNNIYNLFIKLEKANTSKADLYTYSDLPGTTKHKLGITENGHPVFFIKCTNNSSNKIPSYNLGIEVDFGVLCKMRNDSNKLEGNYTIIKLKENTDGLLNFFLDIVYLVVKSIPPNSDLLFVKSEIDKLIEMFSNINNKGSGDIQGLWAELLIIEQSKNPEYLLSAWHVAKSDLFDFNDGEMKLEIKSTSKSERIHIFSHNQLKPNSNLVIGSILILKSGLGKNVFDLSESIEKRIKDVNLILKLKQIITQTLGDKIRYASDVYFDYSYSVDNVKYYEIKNIPNIKYSAIPSQISNVHFECNLKDIEPLKLESQKAQLLISLN